MVNYLVYVVGLPKAKPQEVVITEHGHKGIIQSLTPDFVEVLMFDPHGLRHNLRVVRTNQSLTVPAGFGFQGRVIDPFGTPLDDQGPILGEKKYLPIDPPVAGILRRARVVEPLETGVTVVDMLVPLGLGQRELVLGDQKTGKTIFLLQTIVSQVRKGTICIYVSIGKKRSDQKSVVDYLTRMDVLKKCVLIFAAASDPAPQVFLAPFTGFTLAEFFRDHGNNVLIVLDDLSNHARFYREISLMSKKPPGRQSYPGDIFYLHARQMERAGNLIYDNSKTFSITALPVVETIEGDLTGYIQTNTMAMTDGHIFFDLADFKKGRRPAVNISLSVSRVGHQTKNLLELEISRKLMEKLAIFKKALEVGHFGLELTEKTKQDIQDGEKIETLLNQNSFQIIPKTLQLIFFGLFFTDFWREKKPKEVEVEKEKLLTAHEKGMLSFLEEEIQKINDPETFYKLLKNNHSKVREVISYV